MIQTNCPPDAVIDLNTPTYFTPGSMIFINAAQQFAQNNASLFWDSANLLVKIGTSTGTTAAAAALNYLNFPNLDSGQTTKWMVAQGWFGNTNPGHNRDDTMLAIGYNLNPTTMGALVGTEPGWWIQLETYETTTTPGVPYCEYWVNYQPIGGGGNVRPFGARVNRTTNHCVASMVGDIMQFQDSTLAQQAMNIQTTATSYAIGIGTVPNGNAHLHIKSLTPNPILMQSPATTDTDLWDFAFLNTGSTDLALRVVNDAYNTANIVFQVSRTTTTVNSVTWGAALLGVAGTAAAPTFSWSAEPTTGFYRAAASTISLSIGNSQQHQWTSNTYAILHNSAILMLGATSDTRLARDGAANTLAMVNGANAQTFRIYGTASKLLSLSHNGTNALIDTAASSGAMFLGGNATAVIVNGVPLQQGSDGSADIGNSAGSRFRNLYLTGGCAVKVKAGVPVDGDFTNPVDGMIAVDSTDNKIYVRIGAAWKGVVVA